MIDNYLEKIYAGFLGMNIGIRVGAPVEPTIWTYERIRETYGEIDHYIKDYKNFAADDDANGPYHFLRALHDDAKDREPTPDDVGRAWLNYAREGVGMFWWGGYGRSTEHTAFLNLKHGISAPQSGSIAQNGHTIAEQIGGQIFIDTWGLVSPCDPEAAARRGAVSASVSHDGEGLEGARFICAAIALAFEMDDIYALVDLALTYVTPQSKYRQVAQAVIDFHREQPNDWRACRQMLDELWGYDRYGGACHIIPNAGVCVLSLVYGAGDFNRTVEIATMCGWDTDCNAGNVGTILGVMCGLDGLKACYREPIGDAIVMSGVSGYLNILDIPTYTKELALLGYRLAGEQAPKELVDSHREGEVYLDFELPGSTHNIRVSDPFFSRVEHSTARSYAGKGSLSILIDRANRFDGSRVFYKPFYRRSDFSDERYSPVFSPTAYSGQTLSFKLYLDLWEGDPVMVTPYCRLAMSGEILRGGLAPMRKGEWMHYSYVLPDSKGEPIDEVGFLYEGNCKAKTLGKLYMDEFTVSGSSDYTVDLSKSKVEFGCLTPFSFDHGAWSVEDGELRAICCDFAQAFTGNYFMRESEISAPVTPEHGEDHMLLLRAQGTQRSYLAGLSRPGKVAILKNDFGLSTLAEVDFDWQAGQTYLLTFRAEGNDLTLSIDGDALVSATDDAFAYGMAGFAKPTIGRTSYGNVHIKSSAKERI